MKAYTVASEEGAQRYGVEVGEQVELDLDAKTERALLAAAWLEPANKKKEGK
jgi:hypothetical protein